MTRYSVPPDDRNQGQEGGRREPIFRGKARPEPRGLTEDLVHVHYMLNAGDIPPDMACPRSGRYKETQKLTLLSALCVNSMEIRTVHSRTYQLYVMGKAPHASRTKLFWDKSAQH